METNLSETQRFDFNNDSYLNAIEEMKTATQNFGRVFSSTISSAVITGKTLDETLQQLGKRFLDLALQKSISPLENLFGALIESIAAPGSLSPDTGNLAAPISLLSGGLSSALSAFQNPSGFGGNSLPGNIPGLGIIPSSIHPSTPNVVFNIATKDATSFKRSESQISSLLARTVVRGQRGL